jgi:uncharacterized protein
MVKKTYIVDGYNVIRTTDAYVSYTHEDFDSCATNPIRDKLIADVAAWANSSKAKAIVVFDGTSNPQSNGKEQQQAGISVYFSKYGTSADTLIESLAHKAFERGEQVTVVSSDNTVKWTVGYTEVFTMSSQNFASLIKSIHTEQEEALEERKSSMRLGSRIDPETLRKLKNML